MTMLRVALLQMIAHGSDQDANRAKGEAVCRQAAQMGADIALFPEMWNTGYAHFGENLLTPGIDPDDPAYDAMRRDLRAMAVGPDDPFVMRFRELARELNMAIGLTYLERWEPSPRNTNALFDRHGDIVVSLDIVHPGYVDYDVLRARDVV